jgi:acyl-CoA thioester hydrolase
MACEFKLVRRVEFYETDMAGIVHFANFFRFMEACEHAFVRSLGTVVHPGEDEAGGIIGWPRVHAECDYRRPLRYDEEYETHLLVREKRERALHYDFRFWKVGERAEQPLARGRLVVVSVGRIAGEVKAIPIPQLFADLIHAAPDALLNQYPEKK